MTPIDDAPTPAGLKRGDWTVRLGDGSLVVGRTSEKQTLSLRETGAMGEVQSLPVDSLKRLRRAADGKGIEIELRGGKPWTAALDEEAARATLTFATRWGEVPLPLGKIREAALVEGE